MADVIEFCRLVGGMPLGIELAASWIAMVSPAEIAVEIQRNLDFLHANMRDVPRRQRSVRAVFDSSWKLLTETEQDAFCKLTVFHGSFSRDAAQAVTSASLSTLLALANKTWIQPSRGYRYQIHELVSQYGHEALQTDPDAYQAARYSTLEHAKERRESALELAQEAESWVELAWSKLEMGEIYRLEGDLEAARNWYDEAYQLFDRYQVRMGFALYYRGLGDIAQKDGDNLDARRYFRQYRQIAQERSEYWSVAHALARLHLITGETVLAAELATFVLENPLSWNETKILAAAVLGEVSQSLTPELLGEAMEKGRQHNLADLLP